MSKEIEDKLVKIPVLSVLVRFGKKIKIPGLEGMSLYDVLEMYIIGIVRGALQLELAVLPIVFLWLFSLLCYLY